MPIKKTHYEILGVPRAATQDQIKRRYRQLVRKYHPDVAENKAAAQAAFIRITEAYEVLSNPDKRVLYDVEMDAEMFKPPIRPAQSSQRGTTTTAGRTQRTRTGSSGDRIGDAERWVHQARMAFVRGDFPGAISACREARKLHPGNAQAHAILGDIYKIQGRIDDAIAMYTVAVQIDPRNYDVPAKLNRLIRRNSSGIMHAERHAALKMGLNLMGWSMAAFMFILLALSPGQPIEWLAVNLPIVGTWSNMLFAVLLVNGVLSGFLLSVNETIRPLDDELVFPSVRASGRGPTSYPILLLLIVFNFINFYLAAGLYIVIGLVQESLSKSVLAALVVSFCLVSMATLIYTVEGARVLLFGGNVVLPSVLFGWAIGDMFRPGW